MEGTARLIFNLGAHLLTRELCQGAELHDKASASATWMAKEGLLLDM